ncbi:MAG: hypothetical protein JETT_3897 [Candidatus Jettenia ecosi]|uniref:Uncharacterized protein n=1 Tax=Candidatus Jettenia ecosi TaxID=2494326 RepID=A0A533Q5M6_9BACT|nr:MAG: hypothetical protein JETT_3897 [Candidatus Jettenia ecosi]
MRNSTPENCPTTRVFRQLVKLLKSLDESDFIRESASNKQRISHVASIISGMFSKAIGAARNSPLHLGLKAGSFLVPLNRATITSFHPAPNLSKSFLEATNKTLTFGLSSINNLKVDKKASPKSSKVPTIPPEIAHLRKNSRCNMAVSLGEWPSDTSSLGNSTRLQGPGISTESCVSILAGLRVMGIKDVPSLALPKGPIPDLFMISIGNHPLKIRINLVLGLIFCEISIASTR